MTENPDMPTVARIRARLVELNSEDISVAQAVWVFGVSAPSTIISRIMRGQISAAKVMGEWRIDVESINRYLDNLNQNYDRNRGV